MAHIVIPKKFWQQARIHALVCNFLKNLKRFAYLFCRRFCLKFQYVVNSSFSIFKFLVNLTILLNIVKLKSKESLGGKDKKTERDLLFENKGEIDMETKDMVKELCLGENEQSMYERLRNKAEKEGIYLASIDPLYQAVGNGKIDPKFTVPAINLRTLTYDTAKEIFTVAEKKGIGAFILEIARSEIVYTNQTPFKFSGTILGAAIASGWEGPVFIQGDHYQVNLAKYSQDPNKEIRAIKELISNSINAGFYNIDIDASTTVNLEKLAIEDQQYLNASITAHLTDYIRKIQPRGIQVSVGAEIGEIGGKNSTTDELDAFMKVYNNLVKSSSSISKMSVQTGAVHAGEPLPDGSLAKLDIDFDVLRRLSEVSRDRYHLAGAVQHGASTTPFPSAFIKFVQAGAIEIHLATLFQNIFYDKIPASLRGEMYTWIFDNLASEKKVAQTDEQFIYKIRKKALGPFEKKVLNLPKETRDIISVSIAESIGDMFDVLKVNNTQELILEHNSH